MGDDELGKLGADALDKSAAKILLYVDNSGWQFL